MALIGQRELRPLWGRDRPRCLPNHLVEPDSAAVQRIDSVIDSELIVHAVQGELPPGDAIAVTADEGPEVRIGFEVPGKGIKTQYHVRVLAVTVRRGQRGHNSAVGCDLRLHAVPIAER